MHPAKAALNKDSGVAGTIRGGRILGVPIRFHFTFLLLLVFLSVMGLGGQQTLASGLFYVAALFGSVVLHEGGHAWVARRYGIRTLEVVMFPVGGVPRFNENPKPGQEFWIALAGPLVNLSIAGAAFGIQIWRDGQIALADLTKPGTANLLALVATVNLILAAFNLIPAFPMDGGRALRSLLAGGRGQDEATRIAAAAGRLFSIAMGLYGLLTMHSRTNGSSISALLVFIAFFVYLGAAQEGAAAKGRLLTHGIPVRAATVTQYHTLAHGSTIRDAASLLLSTSQQDFPVMHGDHVIGLLGRNALLRAMATEGPDCYVAGVMDREPPAIPPDMDLSEALPLVAQAGSCALVMDGEQLLGLLTTDNLSEFLVLRSLGLEAGPQNEK